MDINIDVDLSAWLPVFLRAPAHFIIIEPVKRTFYLRRGGDSDCFLRLFAVRNCNAETHTDGLADSDLGIWQRRKRRRRGVNHLWGLEGDRGGLAVFIFRFHRIGAVEA